ncbi:MAG: nucleotide exchange factor GrpE [Proteobacteria bacterium]|nr:nucleotide exchange factor GrpE [Pseudomonadota bacterium]
MVLKEKKTRMKKKDDSPQQDAPPQKDPKDSENGNGKTNDEGLQELKDQIASEKDRVLRLSAEFENYKKRTQREINDFRKFANESVFRQFLSVVDNLERAIASAQESSENSGLFEGVKLTHKEIVKLFETFNLKPVDAAEKPFDPNFHQAVTQEETDDFPENTVTKVLQKGYLLHDRLIRPAMVVVSKSANKKTKENIEN